MIRLASTFKLKIQTRIQSRIYEKAKVKYEIDEFLH